MALADNYNHYFNANEFNQDLLRMTYSDVPVNPQTGKKVISKTGLWKLQQKIRANKPIQRERAYATLFAWWHRQLTTRAIGRTIKRFFYYP
ncbi:MAG: hypothetical protein ACP5T2_06055, partial [Thermoprotei archaeon]